MMKASSILGKNARSQLFTYQYNPGFARARAKSKILTKKYLGKAEIPVPETYAKFKKPQDILRFDWMGLPDSFALKPNKGLGGEGIVVAKKRSKQGSKDNPLWITVDRRLVGVEDLKLHVLDILEGAFSISNVPDIAYIEEFVGRHKVFRRYAYRGFPDIRVIVFNHVPVMAMLRVPTKESGGRANLHQGAIGVGIDIATGITTYAWWHNRYIKYKPETKRKLHGIKIPSWIKILETAVACQDAVGLGYFGVDVILHPKRGPMVLEINNQPGPAIQLANKAGLKKRLERVEGLEVKDIEQGVRIAKSLFAARFADRVKAMEGIKTVHVFERVKLKGKKKKIWVEAKLDTGAWRTSVDKALAEELGLLEEDNVLWYKKVRSSLGKERRPVINLTFWLTGRKIETNANIANRSRLKKKIVIGRKALKGFLVSPELKKE